jgi:hypothetical protein
MYYVTMTDKFLTGWGVARDKLAKLVIECETFEEAETVKENAENRSEMGNIHIRTSRPLYPKATHEVSFHNKADYENWFVKGYFKKALQG